jgi:23S rRNA (pseudouridine1915-N3)-methyltransferase
VTIHIICVGALKESWWRDAEAEYAKRLGKYCALIVDEVKEERLPDRASQAEAEAVKQAEGQALLRRVKAGSCVVALDAGGAALSSEELAAKLESLPHAGKSRVAFIVGGSQGLSGEVLGRADFRLSFSRMTFPRQLMRVILLEQIYRSFKIMKNETYHK